MMEAQMAGRAGFSSTGSEFHSRVDIDQMPETPQRGSYHRRAQSETLFRFEEDNDDDILFDTDVDFNLASMDIIDSTAAGGGGGGFPMPVDSSGKSEGESNCDKNNNSNKGITTSHFRSLSVGSEFFDGYLGFQPSTVGGGAGAAAANGEGEKIGEKRGMHRHSFSMDGTTSSSFEVESMETTKKAMAPDRLAELALIDPKRAKRILANRQSAARSKERKIRYTSELERKVQTLQTEATTLSAQVTMLQRDTSGLTAENKELKLRLQALEQQAHLRDALNETLREEVRRLKVATGEVPAVNGNVFNRGRPPQFFNQSQTVGHFNRSPTQQQQQPQQVNISASSANNQQSLRGQVQHGSMDFHQNARGSHQ